jgi:hypothetical protein
MPTNIVPASTLFHDHLMRSATTISSHAQRLQRQVLLANGLTPSERDQVLGNLVAVREATQRMGEYLETLMSRADPGLREDAD